MPTEPDPPDHHDVTPAERQVLMRVATGRTNAEIAQELERTERAVRGIVERFRDRSGLAGRRLTSWCVRHEGCCLKEHNEEAEEP